MAPIAPLFFSAALGIPLFAVVFILYLMGKEPAQHDVVGTRIDRCQDSA